MRAVRPAYGRPTAREKGRNVRNKTTRFLRTSLVIILLLCLLMFSFLAVFMNFQSRETMNEVGTLYMSGMSEQISLHFQTVVGLRLSQLEALMGAVPTGGETNIEERFSDLVRDAKARGFDYLAFYTSEGDFKMLYGEQMFVTDPPPFDGSMAAGQKKVAVGTDSAGNRIVLMGQPIPDLVMPDGTYIALVAGLPVEYISTTLSLDENNSLVYSHIIRRDGSYVICSADQLGENYFGQIRSLFDSDEMGQAEQYVEELSAAMQENREYSSVLRVSSGERRHLYCTMLPYSEWYLVTVMPYGALDEVVNGLSTQWILLAFGSCGLLLAVLLLIFARYYTLTKHQMEMLNAVRKEAQHANKAKSEFLSNMSHDIRTPMNAIVGMTAIATTNMDDPQQVQNCLKKISLSSKHLLGLINDVLDMSKIESGKMNLNIDQVSLREVMDSIVSIVQPQVKAKRQRFEVSIHNISSENVCCDSVRLNQVLLNLLSNAIKFTPEGGQITVSLHETASPKGEDWVRIHLRVKDNGIGMTPEFQKIIFESFAREDSARVHRTEGTGLGMAITKYIIDMMGGTIELKSELGEGTEFFVTLDMEKADVSEEEMILPSWNMLVVDDDRQLCESAVDSLQGIGIRADWTLDGETALRMVKEHHQKRDDYQIILLDWKLPDIDGIETARRIRQAVGEDLPILLISAYDWSEIEEDARAAGIDGFISKPLFKSTLFYGLKSFVGQQAADGQAVPAHKEVSFAGRRVMVAEDNELNWEIAHELLSELGMELDWAENGKICVDKFRASPVGYYDAILMDLRMPVMTGYEATEAIRAMERPDADIPIVAMTADAFAEDAKKCLECGMNAHIAKPIVVKDVARELERSMKPKG